MSTSVRLRVLPAIPPVDGKSVELRVSGDFIQWRLAGTENGWTNLIALSALTGPQGPIGPSTIWRVNGDQLQYAPEGTEDWQDVIPLADITGPEGGINYLGPWEAGTYAFNSIVESGGSLWFATVETTEEPSNLATDWSLFMPGSGVADGAIGLIKLAPELRQQIIPSFKTVTALLADDNNVVGYAASGADFIVSPGDIIEAQGFRYEVVAGDATEFDEETAGGVRLVLVAKPVNTLEQTLSDGERSQTLSNIGLGGTENLRSTDIVDSGGAPTPLIMQWPDGELALFYRGNSTLHMQEEGAGVYMIKSTDEGKTWTSPVLVRGEAGYDVRNLGGGLTSNGNISLFVSRWNVSAGEWREPQVLRSQNRGATWTLVGGATYLSAAYGASAYGPLANFGSRAVQLLYDSATSELYSAVSTNNSASWTITKIFNTAASTAYNGDAVLTETYLIALDANRGIAVIRDNCASRNHNAIMFTTSDGGQTWSGLQEIGIPMGNQPPTLWFDGEWIWLLYPERITERMNIRGTFTPSLGGTSVTGSHTYNQRNGAYIVLGSVMHIFFDINIATWNGSASGDLVLSGFPQVMGTDLAREAGVNLRRFSRFTWPADVRQITAGIFQGESRISFRGVKSVDPDVAIPASAGGNNVVVSGSLSYPLNKRMGNLDHAPFWHAALLHESHFDDPSKWRTEFPIPIGTPWHGLRNGLDNSYTGQTFVGGDSGYGTVATINGRPTMFHYRGAFNENGIDIYQTNLAEILKM